MAEFPRWRSWVSEPHWKLLALLLSLSLWLYVQGQRVEEAKVRVPVAWKLPVGLASIDPLPMAVTLTVQGTRAQVRAAEAARIPVDLGEVGAGEHGLDFASFSVEGLPGGLSVMGWSPSSVRFTLDDVATRKVRVTSARVGEPDVGYVVDSVVVKPAVVELRGPRQVLANITEVKTLPIDVSGMTEDQEIPAALDLPRNVVVDQQLDLVAKVEVDRRVDTRSFAAVPVLLWKGQGFRVDPPVVTVTLQGPGAALKALKAEEVAAIVHLPDGPDRNKFDAPFGPEEGPRLRILHGGRAGIEVSKVFPARVEVSKE